MLLPNFRFEREADGAAKVEEAIAELKQRDAGGQG